MTDSFVDLFPSGYEILCNLHKDGRHGGGVAVICRQGFNIKTVSTYNTSSFDCIMVKLNVKPKVANIGVIYTPQSKTSASTHNKFIDEFSDILLSELSILNDVIVVGDFNYHVNDNKDIYARKFLQVFDTCGFEQHVNVPTHINTNTLNLIFTREDFCPLHITTDASVSPDHFPVNFCISSTSCEPTKKKTRIKSRNWKSFDMNIFKSDLLASDIHSILTCDTWCS